MMHFKKNIYITFIENSCKLKYVMMGRCIKYMNCVTFKRDTVSVFGSQCL